MKGDVGQELGMALTHVSDDSVKNGYFFVVQINGDRNGPSPMIGGFAEPVQPVERRLRRQTDVVADGRAVELFAGQGEIPDDKSPTVVPAAEH